MDEMTSCGGEKKKQSLTCIKTFILSRGAVPVRLTAPAAAPATRCFHQLPELFSSSVNSSGMARLSPMSSTWWQQESAFLRLWGQYQAHRGASEALPPFLCSILTLTDAALAAECQKEKLGLCANTAARKLAATFFRGVYSDNQASKQCLHICGLYQEACWVLITQQTELLSACFRQTHPGFFQTHKVPLHCQLNAAPVLSI